MSKKRAKRLFGRRNTPFKGEVKRFCEAHEWATLNSDGKCKYCERNKVKGVSI